MALSTQAESRGEVPKVKLHKCGHFLRWAGPFRAFTNTYPIPDSTDTVRADCERLRVLIYNTV